MAFNCLRQFRQRFINTRTGNGGEQERGFSGTCLEGPRYAGCRPRREDIDFAERHEFGLGGKAGMIFLELLADDTIGSDRIFAGDVDQMEENGAALDMAKETMAEARTLARTFDEARNIGEDETAGVQLNDAEMGG